MPDPENVLALLCWLAPELVAKESAAATMANTSQQYLADRARMRDAAKLARGTVPHCPRQKAARDVTRRGRRAA